MLVNQHKTYLTYMTTYISSLQNTLMNVYLIRNDIYSVVLTKTKYRKDNLFNRLFKINKNKHMEYINEFTLVLDISSTHNTFDELYKVLDELQLTYIKFKDFNKPIKKKRTK